MIDSYLYSFYQKKIILPTLKMRYVTALSPYFVTFLAMLFGSFSCIFLSFDRSYLALFCLLFSGFLDTLDGCLARHLSKTSPKGAVLDILSDRFVEFCIILGLLLINPSARAIPALIMLGSSFLCVTSFLVVGIFEKNSSEKSFYYSPGLIERTEAFCFFSLMILFKPFFVPLACLFSGLVLLTAFLRIYRFIKH